MTRAHHTTIFAAGLILTLAATASAQCLAGRFEADIPGNGRFGTGADVSGDAMIVGQHYANSRRGTAYLFERAGGTWAGQGQLTLPALDTHAYFGCAVAMAGDLAVIGAFGDSTQGVTWHGAAYVYRNTGGTWALEAKLLPADPAENALFGWAVDTDGARIVVGVNAASSAPDRRGGAYVFEHQGGGAWAQTAKLLPADVSATDNVGSDVAIDGDTVAFDSRNEGPADEFPGSVYVYRLDNGAWAQEQELTPDDPQSTFAPFGGSLDLQGDTLLAGAPAYNVGTLGPDGEAFIFERAGGAWTQTQTLLPDFAHDTGPFFGLDTKIDGDWIAIGATSELIFNPDPLRTGAIYLFRRDRDDWGFVQRIYADGAINGSSVGQVIGLDGPTLLAACPIENNNTGAIYIFDDLDTIPADFAVDPEVSILHIEIDLPVFGFFEIDIPITGAMIAEVSTDCDAPASIQPTEIDIRTVDDVVTLDLGMASQMQFINSGQHMNALVGSQGSPGPIDDNGNLTLDPVLQPYGTLAWTFLGIPGTLDMDAAPDDTWLMDATVTGEPGAMTLDFTVAPVEFILDLGLGDNNPTVTYSATVRATEPDDTCLPDWNNDNLVDTRDFIAYLNDWAAGNPIADINNDNTVNTLDFIAFLNAWAAGC
ncbi:MAG: GC-type dockerin domain-anchored protein [Phycisphaerales bacterium JB054]